MKNPKLKVDFVISLLMIVDDECRRRHDIKWKNMNDTKDKPEILPKQSPKRVNTVNTPYVIRINFWF